MSIIERVTVDMPADMVAVVKAAVNSGDYASTSEAVCDALKVWQRNRALQQQKIAALQTDLDEGLDDVAAGKLTHFDRNKIIARGKTLLAKAPYALTDTAGTDSSTRRVIPSQSVRSWEDFFAFDATTVVRADFMSDADRAQGGHAPTRFRLPE